jgi:hypothetical protein
VDPTVIGATIGGVATIIGALITSWVMLHQRKPKPAPSSNKLTVGNRNSPSSNASDLIERGLSSYNRGQHQSALNYYQQALVIQKEVGDRAGEGKWETALWKGLLSITSGRYIAPGGNLTKP